jgi:c-di-GMP-binding flagellar brake protein YcgR
MSQSKVSSWGQFLGLRQKGDEGPTPGSDRRACIRHDIALPTRCERANDPEPVLVKGSARNISREGISVVLGQGFEIGDVLKIELASEQQSIATVVLACVVHVGQDGGNWVHGCAFVSELSDQELQQFGAQRVRPEEVEHRTWVRFPCELDATYRLMRVSEREWSRAKVVDISASGVGLLVQRAIDAGALVRIVLTPPDGGESLKVVACVVRVTERPDGELVLGCNFIRELSTQELQGLVPFQTDLSNA